MAIAEACGVDSWYEWYNPVYLRDKRSGNKRQNKPPTTHEYVRQVVGTSCQLLQPQSDPALQAHPQLKDLVQRYQPDILWLDGRP